MAEIRSFRDLNVYQKARGAAHTIFTVTKSFPKEERYALTDQIRRSSRAVAAMIAEAWAKLRYEAAFISKINDALGEAMETQSWLDHARDSDYITPAQFAELDVSWQQIGGMLHKMTEHSSDFCKVSKR
jgi:four helix bundle protein